MSEVLKGNAVIGQSGGPTAAINASLSGILRGVFAESCIEEVYGMKHGIDGILNDNLIKINPLSEEEHISLEATPSCALGSCRKKLPDPEGADLFVYERIFEVFSKYNIRYFFYIGGNDSMDTVHKLATYAKERDYDIKLMGVPKTIDNDLACTDHSPGFGSAAKYIATTVQEICRDCAVYQIKAITIVEIMGRDTGWLAASSGLPRLAGGLSPDLIYLPEVVFDAEEFISSVNKIFETKPNIVVAVSEGIRDIEGKYVGESQQSGAVDIFGHKYLAGAARVLEELVNDKIGCKVRSVELSLPQRCAGHCVSACDIDEAVQVGKDAVKVAVDYPSKNGGIMVFNRIEKDKYQVNIDVVNVFNVANRVSRVEKKYINEEKNNVSDELLYRILPLIQGEKEIPMKNGLPVHFEF